MYPIRYVACYEYELMWLFAGLITGMIFMAIIDFIIDRSKK